MKKARETLEVFAPLANRMGMGKLRAELEDLSFKFLDPDEYTHLVSQIEDSLKDWEQNIEEMQQTLTDSLTELEVGAKKDGTIVALRVHTYANMGGVLSTIAPGIPTTLYGRMLSGVYKFPNIYCHLVPQKFSRLTTCQLLYLPVSLRIELS